MTWIFDRLKEKASHGGIGLIAVGVIMLLAPVDLVAYAAILFGAWQLVTKG